MPIDLARLRRRLGADHVLLLRLHSWSPAGSTVPPGAPVIDVSDRAESAELYLAADVLVTDYSSAMFDFAVTGKPMLFFTYDLEHYRDELRGFYFDLAEGARAAAPHQRRTSRGHRRHRRRRRTLPTGRRFRDTFCPLEDGHATDRVLDLRSRWRLRRTSDQEGDDVRTYRPSPDELSARSGPHRGATAPAPPVQAVILAAGMGTRLGRSPPKPLSPCATGAASSGGRSTTCAAPSAPTRITVVVGFSTT